MTSTFSVFAAQFACLEEVDIMFSAYNRCSACGTPACRLIGNPSLFKTVQTTPLLSIPKSWVVDNLFHEFNPSIFAQSLVDLPVHLLMFFRTVVHYFAFRASCAGRFTAHEARHGTRITRCDIAAKFVSNLYRQVLNECLIWRRHAFVKTSFW